MSLGELTKYIVCAIVENTDEVQVTETKNDKEVIINVKVNDSDMGRLIGRDGKMINSIRTLIQEASSLKDGEFVKVEVEKEEN